MSAQDGDPAPRNLIPAGAPLGWVVRDTDDPRVVARQQHEDYTNHVVPLTARQSRWAVLGAGGRSPARWRSCTTGHWPPI